MAGTNTALSQIEIDLYRTSGPVPTDVWEQGYAIAETAFAHEFSRHQPEEIAQALGGGALNFINNGYHPELMVQDGRLNNQNISRTALVVARDTSRPADADIVGIAISGDAVSGPAYKRLILPKRHRWLRLIAVSPLDQDRGIADLLGAASFGVALPLQGTSAYTYEGEGTGAGTRKLTSWDMPAEKGGQLAEPFKEGEEVTLKPHSNTSARKTVHAIARGSQAPDRVLEVAHSARLVLPSSIRRN